MPIGVRCAAIADAGDILGIYAPYITDSCISFETEVPLASEFALRVENIIKRYPFFVYETDSKIAGYAYASQHRERSAYRYSADVSVYIAREYQGQGIGKSLYTKLFELLSEHEIYTVFAGISLPNEKSVGLHRSFGFSEVGVFHNAGYKFGRWLDVMWMEKALRIYDTPKSAYLKC